LKPYQVGTSLSSSLDEFDRTLVLAAIDDAVKLWEQQATRHDLASRRQLATLRRQMIHDVQVLRRAIQVASGVVLHDVAPGPGEERQWTGRLPR